MTLASIPSPSQGVWHLGPIPLRGYAFAIILGIALALWLTQRRWLARGGEPGVIGDVAMWAVPFGLVGGRLYHVITTPDPYFGEGGRPLDAFAVWKGGLGIWGAIALGAVGAAIACRRRGASLAVVADAAAPGIAMAQGVGRWGNWFNQELFGRPTDLPWGLEIAPENRPAEYALQPTFHPTFLYEFLWDMGVAGLVIWADRRFRLGHGRAFALYVAAYTAGRGWIEYLRIDPAEHILGLRLNVWVSILVFAGAVAGFLISLRRHPGRETLAEVQRGTQPDVAAVAASAEPEADATPRLGDSRDVDRPTDPDIGQDVEPAVEPAVEPGARQPVDAVEVAGDDSGDHSGGDAGPLPAGERTGRGEPV